MKLKQSEYNKIKQGKELVSLEDDDAVIFVKFLTNSGIKDFSHIPMETRTPYHGVLKKLTKMGVKKGLPDYLITLPVEYTGQEKRKLIFIELKRRKRGVVSDKQKRWLEVLNECQGIEAHVAKGLKEAIAIVEFYYKFNKNV